MPCSAKEFVLGQIQQLFSEYNGAITCQERASVQKNSRPQALKRGAGTDFAHAHHQSGAAESEKRGDVKHVIGKHPGCLYRREQGAPRINRTADIP